jgi:hypothetical protein
VNDIALVARMLDEQGLLPRSTVYAEFALGDRRHQFNWFWCQVFPKTIAAGGADAGAVVFEPGARDFAGDPDFAALHAELAKVVRLAGAFEAFLEHQRHLRRFQEWHAVVRTQVARLMVGHIEHLVAHPGIARPHEIAQMAAVARIDRAVIAAHEGVLGELAAVWNQAMAPFADGKEIRRMLRQQSPAYATVWQGIRTLHCLVTACLDRTFRPMMDALLVFQAIDERLKIGPELLCSIVRLLPGKVVLVPFVVFNATVVRNQTFLSEVEKHAWLALEACILRCLTPDPVFMCKIVSVQEDIARGFR